MERDILYKIRIKKTPEGPAPENIRMKWKEIELLAIETPPGFEEYDFTTNQEFGNRDGYLVLIESALKALAKVSEESANWFHKNIPSNYKYISFARDEVEILGDDSIIGREEL